MTKTRRRAADPFVIRASGFIRISGFVIRVSPTCSRPRIPYIRTGVTMTSTRLYATTWIASVVFLLGSAALAEDWPQWRGPGRDGISKETGLAKQWPADGPKLLWQVKDIGQGYGAPAVVGEHLYIQSNKGLDDEFVEARKVADGSRVWSTRIGKVGNPDQRPAYPAARSTPTIEGDVLYALGSDGDLVCLDLAAGKEKWKKSLRSDFGGKPGAWAYAESPL